MQGYSERVRYNKKFLPDFMNFKKVYDWIDCEAKYIVEKDWAHK